ncbi:hypothetical protein ON021_35490, partial [Microcoleus sp. HI-ES]|nr:hypothetical protein [Microcoleus sp. HI-ES]
ILKARVPLNVIMKCRSVKVIFSKASGQLRPKLLRLTLISWVSTIAEIGSVATQLKKYPIAA